ncbi:VWA domain-containing protein [Bacteroidota bacterium]
MKKLVLPFLLILIVPFFLSGAKKTEEKNSTIQIAILLDTSNSMDGLIDQAKTQLWKIVNELARSKRDGETIDLQVALYEYGNNNIPEGESYVKMIVPLSTDLDKISDELFNLTTNGGDEYCGTVIKSAVSGLKWNEDNDMLKIIVIAGNEPFTQGGVDYNISCKDAISKGIIVNTIFCGNYEEGVNTHWKAGADIADGKYMNIDQNQQIVHIDAPQDEEIAMLGMGINKTYITYGMAGREKKALQAEQDENSANISPAVMAERAVAKAGAQYRNEAWDLVDAEEQGIIDLDKLDEEYLPKELKELSKDERIAFIENKRKERVDIQSKINKLNEDRRKFIAEKMLESETNTFDAAMINVIREQAKAKNYDLD